MSHAFCANPSPHPDRDGTGFDPDLPRGEGALDGCANRCAKP
jgi:hypothetical protein